VTCGVVVSWVLAPAPARAADKLVCLAAHEGAQRDRQENRLLVARDKLLRCSDGGCPQAVRDDCAAWLTFLDQELPMLMVEARDENGHVVSAVSVFADETLLATRLDGHALRLDPGDHVLRFEHPPNAPVLRKVSLGRGERPHLLFVSFGGWAAPPKPLVAAAVAPAAPTVRQTSSSSVAWPIVLAGAGVAALGTSLVLGLGVRNDREGCRPCSADESAALDRRLWVADVPLAAGVILSGIATWLLLSPSAARSTSAAQLQAAPIPWSSAGFASVRCEATRQ